MIELLHILGWIVLWGAGFMVLPLLIAVLAFFVFDDNVALVTYPFALGAYVIVSAILLIRI